MTIEHPDIPVHVAAIGPNMCAVAGEVADGVLPTGTGAFSPRVTPGLRALTVRAE